MASFLRLACGFNIPEDIQNKMKEHLETKNAVKLDAPALISCIKWYKDYQLNNDNGADADEYLDAFVALGGETDGTGTIHKNTLIEIIKIEFELTVEMSVSET